MARTAWAVHGTGADITVRTGARGDTFHGDTDTAVHGTTEDGTVHGDSADGMIRGIMTRGTEEDGIAALENPNSPKVVLDKASRAIYFSRSVIPYLRGVEREQWLKSHTYYKHIGMYAFRANVLREVTSLEQSPLELAESLEQLRWLENGYKIGVGISNVETVGIDTPEDLERAEAFLREQNR